MTAPGGSSKIRHTLSISVDCEPHSLKLIIGSREATLELVLVWKLYRVALGHHASYHASVTYKLGKGVELSVSFVMLTLPFIALLATGIYGVSAAVIEKRAQPVGLDVSGYQGSVSWSTVAANGAQFAYVKATEGTCM